MCDPGEVAGPVRALAVLEGALRELACADVASLPAAVQAGLLRGLERAESRHTAARARLLAAFTAQDGYAEDGQGSARVWLKWQARITAGAAAGAVGWMKRLGRHPVVERALAAGEVSASWARLICGWSDRLPADRRGDAGQILCAAAAGGASLADLARLAEELLQRCGRDDARDDGFEDRYFRLGITFGGTGRAEGDLTPGCAAAVLAALGKTAGPEDTRTAGQRRHDALAEACRRLITAGWCPAGPGSPPACRCT